MHHRPPLLPSAEHLESRYAVRLLTGARAESRGLACGDGKGEGLVPWDRVRRVLAAEVGEPQGVRAVVFDVVLRGGPGEALAVLRFDAEPGEEAVAVARGLRAALPPERLGAAIKALASEGLAGEWYPDLESFSEAALASLASTGD